MVFSCSSGGSDDDSVSEPPQDIIPSNLVLNIDIVGSGASNPNGDGSGEIIANASATNAVRYVFKFNNEEIQSTNGSVNYTFLTQGNNSHLVSVFAYSSTGHSISTFKNVTVFVNDEPQLIWSDEFNTDGAPDSSKWGYDIGAGGWGNGESQFYTDRSDNVIVENGLLKITAKKESYQGSDYTSTRMTTQDKYEFTYGKIEVRAKLPEGAGTWPAIWLLGANIDTVGWPACGEIDIMEHWGHNPTIVSSATHTPSCSGGCMDANVGEITVSDFATEFHVYGLEWTENKLRFFLDDNFLYEYNPTVKNASTWPFNNPHFFILNIAMGGNWFSIDSNFSESTMEIDYVRVYQ
ncbi:glycoside hydrolase family 16 protein [Flavobacteriaceae bacterium S0825]|uniref:glycoside hydrolase family 16 protein n=1 Tax=Gaetbulibacter sp. S0825 TaxID=2720084 RepID=UPI001430288B|nr:glycoside hydrolase family 16 protein [Gaetbulibacter sp. S0825]MCK0110004.1 glycoside hydrolase family 16 protein [Flavobacteriaceae bacterium S0825]NIX65633.1 glycoside hydrolase family 16 protein [Gaetbulibacter sp. S0825]